MTLAFYRSFFSLFFCLSIGVLSVAQTDNRPMEKDVAVEKVFIEANNEKVLGNHESAAYLFTEVTKKDKENDAAFYELARLEREVFNKPEKALKYAETAFNLKQDNFWYGSLYAELLSDNKKYKEAASIFKTLAKHNNHNEELYFDWAYFLVKANDTDQALKVYEIIEEKFGVNYESSKRKHALYSAMKKEEKAIQSLEELIKEYPTEVDFQHMLADYYLELDEQEEADKIFKRILEINPDDPRANLSVAESLKVAGKDSEYLKSIQPLYENPEISIDTKIHELFPYVMKAEPNGDPAMNKELLNLSKILTEVHPGNAKSYSIYGDFLNNTGNQKEALVEYEKALALDDSKFSLWQYMLVVNYELQNYDQLVKRSEDAMDLFPNQPLVYYMNGLGYNAKGEYNEGIGSLKQALMMSGDNGELKAQIHTEMGNVYNEMKKYKDSDAAFEAALNLNSDNPYVLNNYGYFLSVREEKLEKAEKMSAKANELSPNSPAYQDTYGWILYKLNRFEDAKTWIGKAMKNGGEDDAEILEHYGDILFKLNDISGAVNYWQKALDNGSKSDMLQKKITDRKLY